MSKIPTIADIYNGNTNEKVLSELQKNEQFLALMNQQPPADWIKKNKFANNSAYLPIDKVEFLLKVFFKEHRIEILKSEIAFNACVVTVRVHYKHPIKGEWTFHDGIGAADVQTKAGCSASDLASINRNAVAMAFPIAKSEAIKDACHLIGDIFGGNLNRKDTIEYLGDAGLMPEPDTLVIDKDYAIQIVQTFESLTNQKERAELINGIEQHYWQTVMSDCVHYLNSHDEMKEFWVHLSAPIKHAIQPLFTDRKKQLGG